MVWDADKPISYWPAAIRKYFRDEAKFLYHHLEQNKLKIILIPAPEQKHCGHKIRMVDQYNPQWYSELYHSLPHFRRDRSLRSLQRIDKGEDQPFIDQRCGALPYRNHYDCVYRETIFKRLIEGHITEGYQFKPKPKVCAFFGIEAMVNSDLGEIPF